ncbi:copper chaperone PCu(A)C [Gilvimarinus agarilyticus]|uniref:copper chaperone PCu(A)C n=1 Tax=Gilvimarinus agarilyticus TaxID=679259 RepID=UPI000695D8E0|nr:copper chaperone PCu(A)C [Gilvimarinus agarilyticus]
MSLFIAPRLTRLVRSLFASCLLLAVAAQTSAAPALKVSDATLQLPIPGTHNSAVYLRLVNTGSEPATLVGVTTTIAEKAQLHSHTNIDGMMRMRPVDSLTIAPGETVVFESGGYHIMLLGVQPSLASGDTVELTLKFDDGSTTSAMARAVSRYDRADHSHHH